MTIFNLNLAISAADLAVIALAGESITIAFGVNAFVSSASKAAVGLQHQLVWLAFAPLQNNVVSFTDTGFLAYAAAAMPAAGAVVQMGSTAIAVPGMVLPFQANATFGSAQSSPGLGPDDFALSNSYTASAGYTVLGLALEATVNGVLVAPTPIVACVTPNMQQAQFSPTYDIQVFLQSNTSNAMMLPNSIAGVPIHTLSAAQPSLSLTYNAKTGAFQ